jgi:hypothetical protein
MGVGGYTYLVHQSVFLKLGETRSEALSTQPELNGTQRVLPSQIEHSANFSKLGRSE